MYGTSTVYREHPAVYSRVRLGRGHRAESTPRAPDEPPGAAPRLTPSRRLGSLHSPAANSVGRMEVIDTHIHLTCRTGVGGPSLANSWLKAPRSQPGYYSTKEDWTENDLREVCARVCVCAYAVRAHVSRRVRVRVTAR